MPELRAVAILAFLLSFAPAIAGAQNVRMVALDPVSRNVTLRNYEAAIDVDISSFQMCRAPGTYSAISALPLVAGDLSLSPGEEVTIRYDAILEAGTGIGFYVSAPFGTPANMRDYMQFKGVAGFRESVAVAAGIWSAGTFAAGEGPYVYTGDGLEDGAAFWSTPIPTPALGAAGGPLLLALLAGAGVYALRFASARSVPE
jgi:hypothetical protein